MLFIVLMVVALSSLAATFAVQDSSYSLKGIQGVKQTVAARYVAESGLNSASVWGGTLREQLKVGMGQVAQSLRTTPANFPSARYNMPPLATSTKNFLFANMDDVENVLMANNPTPQPMILQDVRSPYTARYDAVYEGNCAGDGKLHFDVSVISRETLVWNAAAGDYSGSGDLTQTSDANAYHDTVSLARTYYAMENSGCAGQGANQ